MNIKNPFVKRYLIVAGAVCGLWLALMASAYPLIIQPQSRVLAKVQNDFAASNEQYSLAQTAQREDTKKNMAGKLEDVKELTRMFVINPNESAQLTFKISQLAAQCHLGNFTTKIREMTGTLDEQENHKIGEGWVELSFSATFNQFAAFLNSLERNQPVVFVESAAIKRSDNGSLHDAKVLVSYLPDKPDLGSLAQQP